MEKTPFPTTLDELETYPQQTLTAEQVAQFLGCSVQYHPHPASGLYLLHALWPHQRPEAQLQVRRTL